jgi:hypothetical protein
VGIARRSSDLDLAIFSPEATPTEWANLCDALQNTPIIVRHEQRTKRCASSVAQLHNR